EMVSVFLMAFENDGIRVIKCGLHASEFVEQDMIGGFYHPAFRELCENEIYKRQFEEIIAYETSGRTDFTFAVNPSCISKAIGQNRSNINYFRNMILDDPLEYKIKIIGDESVPKYKVEPR
ncbi:MAG: radical SAM protein, partial [Ruminococcus sp.]|nr:radical SAM protein [Ruminococcus sp.]